MTFEELNAEMVHVADLYRKAHEVHWEYVRDSESLGKLIDHVLSDNAARLREPANRDLYARLNHASSVLWSAWMVHRPPEPSPEPIPARLLEVLSEPNATQ